ncbi:cation-transporting ATPase E [Breznakia sp. PF5-3]|uniref:HAD-IC family P-type ATPase n=1 Tax=unclassified Breznakia TaxID=2623764 RepID=UPI002406BBD0|nr:MULTISPECIES: HAD-IC family P-type ATPase [unclassified Breznakia]MDF9824223.1 cation-transporting ATPase E [Breznakia sp. PM6-1]MDF9835021.1 cation-transporting ATPase E [Breznakia sp. PF5-3]MDF9837266.1 cation-transporting ATPase E [Breznakia sp. PFB2-8]MDF9859256.1 cation-transporting ATPase E [Breznakia sp. PH5-24]
MKRYKPDTTCGLTSEQVKERIKQGLVNVTSMNKTKSYKQIIFDNLFTLFNFVNIVLALIILPTGSYRNLLFLGVVVSNFVIGTFQEIRAKRTLDQIAVVVCLKAMVIRDGKVDEVAVEDVVLDDLIQLKTGNQIVSDSIVREGILEVDESLLSGESKVIVKQVGDFLYSGSFVVSGEAIVQVDRVGDDNYAAKITSDAKQFQRYPSELRDSLNKIIKIIGIIIIPLGSLMFIQSHFFNGNSYSDTVLNMAAALIGMIPEGLVILTSIALTVGTINLARHKTLVQELYCLETLARVDTLCLDKTGTITEGKMEVKEVVVLSDDDIDEIMGNYVRSMSDDNATFLALRNHFEEINTFEFISKKPFSSKRKYSGAVFTCATYVLGAFEFVCNHPEKYQSIIDDFSEQGYRVIVLAKSNKTIEEALPDDLEVIAVIALADKIRDNAKETLAYFDEQGVTIKVISGDNPLTVSKVAKRAGVKQSQKYLNASQLTNVEITKQVEECAVFGRVSPEQKKMMVKALKEHKHIVGMTGDGVNDVLAFKEANISIAMASGSDVAKASANLVLLDNNFDALPYVLNEGRRVINNVEKVATLFLTKTIFSLILAFLVLIVNVDYPFIPIQLTIVSSLTIGFPAFVLALEPNHDRVKGAFLENIMKVSLPAALSVIIAIIYVMVLFKCKHIDMTISRQLAFLTISLNGLIVLAKVARPFSKLRLALFISMSVLLFVCVTIFHRFFEIPVLNIFALSYYPIVVIAILLGVSYGGRKIVEYLINLKRNKR